MGLSKWFRRRAAQKTREELLRMVQELREPMAAISDQIDASGGQPVSEGQAFERLVELRQGLHEQIVDGPLTPDEVDHFLMPHLAKESRGVAMAVRASIEKARQTVSSNG